MPDSVFALLTPGSYLPRVLHVLNKIDLDADLNVDKPTIPDAIFTSALTGQGIELLAATIMDRLIERPPSPGDAVPFTERHAEHLRAASAALLQSDLPSAQNALREVIGAK
jgi:50S ribosomal subunit-associated GTPase HflX